MRSQKTSQKSTRNEDFMSTNVHDMSLPNINQQFKNKFFLNGLKVFNVILYYTKWIILIGFQIAISVYVFMIISGQVNRNMQFNVTPQQTEAYATVQTYRNKLIVEKPVKNDVWLATIPVTEINRNGKTFQANVVTGEVEFIGPYPKNKNQKTSMDGYNGPMSLLFNSYITTELFILLGREDSKHLLFKVLDITNVVELNSQLHTCFTLQVHVLDGIFNVKITDGCMFIKSSIQRWAIKSRRWPADYPEKIPEGAQGTNHFAITFHREQPCHFSVEYMKDLEVIHSVPVKTVEYEPYRSAPGDTNRHYLHVIGESFDGIHFETRNQYSYTIEQSMKYYQETNKFYPLKTKIALDLDDDTSMEHDEIKNFKINNDMWLDEAKFKYDVTSKNCYIINTDSKILLEKESVEFVVHGDAILVIVTSIADRKNVQSFVSEKYGVLIENDAKKCGIHDVKQN